MRALIGLLVLLLLVGGGAALWIRAEGEAPSIEAPEAVLLGRAGTTLPIAIADPRSGLRSLSVELVSGDQTRTLLAEQYPGNLASGGTRSDQQAQVALDPKALGELASDAHLKIAARDWSWRGWLSGNEATRELPITVDLKPPQLSVATGLSYAQRGGSGAVAYTLSEPTVQDGVRVADHFYPGFPKPGGSTGERVALFALPADTGPDAKPQVIARDAAGNEASALWPLVIKERVQPMADVNLPQSFVDLVLPRLASGQISDPAASFDDVNTRLRAENEKQIREHLAERSPTPLFDGALQQWANSQVTSRFAEKRTYFIGSAPVSKATHYGYDLATTTAAPVTAAQAGRVAYAGDLGIYGNCVLIDHGLGLATLYGHLSRLDVQAGAQVTRGQTLGLSGATGLAGGDHLHFAVLVGDTYVDPVEWWDAKWVETHISDRWQAPPAQAAAN
jgi:hypothetical protein